MTRLTAVNPAKATGKTKELLDGVEKKLGLTPNMMRTMAHSPAVLEGYLDFSGALSHGKLNAKLREQIALTSAEINNCDYCASAHTAIGKMVGLGEEAIFAAREGRAADPKAGAALKFARDIIVNRGEVSDADLEAVTAAGFDEGEIAEIVANVALNIFTNYFNLAAGTEIDFPAVRSLASR
ncbi:MAG: carboxymuconolactone decarboxylase family protein [Acidobacteriota bacterium]